MTTDEAAGRMVHTPTEAPRVLEAPGVTRLRLLLAERYAEIERMTAERAELISILRDIVCRARDAGIEVSDIHAMMAGVDRECAAISIRIDVLMEAARDDLEAATP